MNIYSYNRFISICFTLEVILFGEHVFSVHYLVTIQLGLLIYAADSAEPPFDFPSFCFILSHQHNVIKPETEGNSRETQ